MGLVVCVCIMQHPRRVPLWPALLFVASLPLHNIAFGTSGILAHATRRYPFPVPLRWPCGTLMYAVSFHLSAGPPHVRILDVPVAHRILQHWRCPSLPNQMVLCCCLPVTKPIAQTVSPAMGPSSRACHPIPVDPRHHGQLASFSPARASTLSSSDGLDRSSPSDATRWQVEAGHHQISLAPSSILLLASGSSLPGYQELDLESRTAASSATQSVLLHLLSCRMSPPRSRKAVKWTDS